METKKYICIECPNSCNITLGLINNEVIEIRGASCSKGESYAKQECYHPMRMITSFVKVINGEEPVVSVKLSDKVDKNRIFDFMNVIKAIKVVAPVQQGQVILESVLGENISIIATKTVKKVGVSKMEGRLTD